MKYKIRAFDGTLRDAEGVIDVDRATFDDCSYSPEYVVALVDSGRQRIWVAEIGSDVAGFVSAFATRSLAADRWEIDELAVRPSAQGEGIGTALVGSALACAPPEYQARATIAGANVASQRAFAKNGFIAATKVDLLVRDLAQPLSSARVDAIRVRRALPADAPLLAELAGCACDRAFCCLCQPDNAYLISGQACVELIAVRTLQYSGFWIESFHSAEPDIRTIGALLVASVELAQSADATPRADLIGHLASLQIDAIYAACTAAAFTRVGEYQTWLSDSDEGSG